MMKKYSDKGYSKSSCHTHTKICLHHIVYFCLVVLSCMSLTGASNCRNTQKQTKQQPQVKRTTRTLKLQLHTTQSGFYQKTNSTFCFEFIKRNSSDLRYNLTKNTLKQTNKQTKNKKPSSTSLMQTWPYINDQCVEKVPDSWVLSEHLGCQWLLQRYRDNLTS